MTKETKIRIIKKKNLAVVKKAVRDETKAKQEAAREMVSNVSSWVSEFQQRKRTETKQAIEQLFPVQPQTDCG
jgi:glyoxylate carboligase